MSDANPTTIETDTLVTFPTGACSGVGQVLGCYRLATGGWGVVVDATPFHPVSHLWPDQPADRGWLNDQPLTDCLTGTVNRINGGLQLGQQISARRGDPDHRFVVVHCLAGERCPVTMGDAVQLRVDTAHRQALSQAHSACHLATLALNESLEAWWRKDPGIRDARGHIDFDRLAIAESRITPGASVDTYRLGKSLRKRGFRSADACEELSAIEFQASALLASWLSTGVTIAVECEGPGLSDSRRWVAQVADEPQWAVFCGGTHVVRMDRSTPIEIELTTGAEALILATRTACC
jgi:alanyl-tRNA synthetase